MGHIKGFLELVGLVALTAGGVLTFLGQVGFSPQIGPEAANAALAWLGDPCDGITHPAYNSRTRTDILDGVRAGEKTDEKYVVGVMAMRGEWAYVEASPYQGPESGQYKAYILTTIGNGWGLKWTGDPGAEPGNPDYPAGFDDNLLRCKEAGCSTT
jgi:hypothetical protein